jgi:hypothetical protein
MNMTGKIALFLGAAVAVAGGAAWMMQGVIPPSAPPSAPEAPAAAPQAPAEVAPPPAPADLLPAAFAVAFPGAAGYRPERLVPVGGHYAVIALREFDGGHAEGGSLAVRYVDRVGEGFAAVGQAVRADAGSFGRIGGWTLRADLADTPLIVLTGGGTWQGCTIETATLIALDPDVPRVVLGILPLSFDNGGASEEEDNSWESRLARAGDAIRVQYSGALDAVVTLRRRGAAYGADRPFPEGC